MAEEYCKKFRHTKKVLTDSYKEHIVKLERYLDKWIELTKCEDNVKALKDLMLREQVLETLPHDLAIHIRDRMPENAKVISEIATIYEQSRALSKVHALNPVHQEKHSHGQKLTSD